MRHLADGSAEVTSARTYEPFGVTFLSAGAASSSYAFTGEWLDPSGLIHLRARYLDPSQGRFFQPDPWRGDFGKPQSLNGYAYALNNPALLTDPSGQCVEPASFLVCVTVAGIILGTSTGIAYNVYVVQEKGGPQNPLDLINPDYYCDVDWGLALFSGVIGGVTGGITAATIGHATEVFYGEAAEEALAQDYGFRGRGELVQRAEQEGLTLREYLLGWDSDRRQFDRGEFELARQIESERGITLASKQPNDPGNFDWVGSDGRYYDAMEIPPEGRNRPIYEQADQFISSLDRHLQNKAGPNGEPVYVPISLEEADPDAREIIKSYMETLSDAERRRILPLDF